MGQRASTEEESQNSSRATVPSFAPTWSIIVTETLDQWRKISGSYGFADFPYGCTNRECDRDAVCLKVAKAIHRKTCHVIEVHRYKHGVNSLNYSRHAEIRSKFQLGFQLSEMLAALKDSLGVLILYRWERLQYDAVFIIVDLDSEQILGHFESPTINMSTMECKISPDKTKIAILFYFRKDNSLPFQYDLYVFCTKTCRVVDIINCNTEVRPYLTFDPRFKSSRLTIVNYRNPEDGMDSLVLYCLEKKEVIAMSRVMLSVLSAGGYFCINYSKDGHFLILQKISEHLHGGHCYADSYIFHADNLKLLRHYFTNLQRFSTFCDSNYAPVFSNCGNRMCILSEQMTSDEKTLHISVFQLPRPISLQEQCRIAIHQSLDDPVHVSKLPLPSRVKDFLNFQPEL